MTDLTGLSVLITAMVAAIGAIGGGIITGIRLWRAWLKEAVEKAATEKEALKTVEVLTTKDKERTEAHAKEIQLYQSRISELEQTNANLWKLLEGATS